MHATDYGPFADVVAIALALVATFSMLLLKMLGRMTRWSWLVSGSPPFLVTAGARVFSVALMAVVYITISKANMSWFAGATVISGFLGMAAIIHFDRLRKLHVLQIPLVGDDGQQPRDGKNNPVWTNVIIGSESNMLPTARQALDTARTKRGGLTIPEFMKGYGSQKVNDPEALWDRELLAKLSNALTVALMSIVLLGVMTLYLAAFLIEVSKT